LFKGIVKKKERRPKVVEVKDFARSLESYSLADWALFRHARLASSAEFWVAGGRVVSMVFKTIEVLVAFAANIAAIGLFLLHTDGASIWNRGKRINNGERPISVILKFLCRMAMLKK